MAARTLFRISCDYPGCSNETAPLAVRTVTLARALARRRLAWARRFGPSSCGYDLCPAHRREVPGDTFPEPRGRRPVDPRKARRT